MSPTYSVRPIGWVSSSRREPIDDNWSAVRSSVTLDEEQFTTEALMGLGEFSHVEVVFLFDQVDEADIQPGARRPRSNPDWPRVGIFAQRAKMRPNRLAVSVCRLLGIDGLTLVLEALDAIDGTPVLDVKPVMPDFLPRGEIRAPVWSRELMATYWSANRPE